MKHAFLHRARFAPVLILCLAPALACAQANGLPAFNASSARRHHVFAERADDAAAHDAVVPAGDAADDDELHAHHHRAVAAAQALGTATTPPNQVLVGLAMFLTFVMSPVLDRAYNDGYKPFSDGSMPMEQAVQRGVAPFKTFMLKQTRETDLALFAKISKAAPMQGLRTCRCRCWCRRSSRAS